MSQILDISKILQFVKQNLPIVSEFEYSKIVERVFAFLKHCDHKHCPDIVNLWDLAANKWHWNFIILETIRIEWVNLELSELTRIMNYLRVFLKTTISISVSTQDIKNWTDILSRLISNSFTKGIGIVYFLADIYIEEIKSLNFQEILQLIEPFVELMKNVQIPQLIEMVYSRIFLRMKDLHHKGLGEWVFSVARSK